MKLEEIARRVKGRCVGDGTVEIEGLGTLAHATPKELSFLANPRLRAGLRFTRAGGVILREEDIVDYDGPAVVCADPYLAYAAVARLFDSTPVPAPGCHPAAIISLESIIDDGAHVGANAVVEAGARIEASVIIGAGCVVGRDAVIGQSSRLHANVTVYHGVKIGQRCVIQSGAVLGGDGFGNAHDNGQWVRIPQLGGLTIGDDVQVGANTTIDRGSIEDTRIGDGVVIDNLVQIAHNCQIGDHTAIAGCVGIAGSAVIGNNCTLAGGVGIADNLNIADDVHLTGMTLVTSSIDQPGSYSSGMPQMASRDWRLNAARFRRLDKLARRVHRLEREIGKSTDRDGD
ncbi:MAG: UDP-3-O-(3-hydroxymyristoyl)glucosamine N-acyltransferase [Pseudomonadota bacterium]|nr:UDP-3-O-(3-hydroxymyristoyl)glucosamine N-acyltransferase [Pseudomonadota bacterium]